MEKIIINKEDFKKWTAPCSDYYLSFETGLENSDVVFETIYPFIRESYLLTPSEIEIDFYCGGFYSYKRAVEECLGEKCYAPIMWDFMPHSEDEDKMIIIRYGRDM